MASSSAAISSSCPLATSRPSDWTCFDCLLGRPHGAPFANELAASSSSDSLSDPSPSSIGRYTRETTPISVGESTSSDDSTTSYLDFTVRKVQRVYVNFVRPTFARFTSRSTTSTHSSRTPMDLVSTTSTVPTVEVCDESMVLHWGGSEAAATRGQDAYAKLARRYETERDRLARWRWAMKRMKWIEMQEARGIYIYGKSKP